MYSLAEFLCAIFLSGIPSLSRHFDLSRQIGSPDVHHTEAIDWAVKQAKHAISLSSIHSMSRSFGLFIQISNPAPECIWPERL